MNRLETKDALSMINLDLNGLASTLLSLSETENIYDLPVQLQMFSHILSHAAEQIDRIIDGI